MFGRALAILVGAAAIASCLTTEGPTTGVARDPSMGRTLIRGYAAISDRYISEVADFGALSSEALRSVATLDPQVRAEEADGRLRMFVAERMVADRPAPMARGDGPGWGEATAELVEAAYQASTALRAAGKDKVLKAALDGTTRKLDRNSRYADPSEARDNRFNREGDGGIGVTVENENSQTVIRSVQPGAPADIAGVRAGDRIVSVAGASVAGQPMREIVRALRGRVGADVAMGVFRPSENREIVFTLRRAYVIPTTATYERRGDIAHIRLTGFNKSTPETLRSTLEKAAADIGPGMAGVILDMRDNPGGLLDRAISVADLLLDGGIVLSTEGRHPDSRTAFRSSGGAVLQGVPMVVVMNGRSASAAEIVGAALQDRGRAVLVGSTSYGKGTVQTVVPLPNDGELTLTWSRMLAPSGYAWNEIGVLPTVCTARFGDAKLLAAELDASAQAVRRAQADWLTVRERAPPERIAALRSICPPSDQAPVKDLELADRILRDRALYARALTYVAPSTAERR
ncbi:MAG: S41 family peptidase [Rhodospirillales bacterium]|nr:MAG: S41 family peptidase [Rhodospirillales bacterium]